MRNLRRASGPSFLDGFAAAGGEGERGEAEDAEGEDDATGCATGPLGPGPRVSEDGVVEQEVDPCGQQQGAAGESASGLAFLSLAGEPDGRPR